MQVLFDNGVPRGVASALKEHVVEEARDRGWDRLTNGDLLTAAEVAGFEVLLTTDRNIRYQQNLSKRVIAIVALSKGSWPLIKRKLPEIAAAVAAATPGSYVHVEIPSTPISATADLPSDGPSTRFHFLRRRYRARAGLRGLTGRTSSQARTGPWVNSRGAGAMSIYATLWRLRFPRRGDAYDGCEWVDVFAQGVPAHIGTPTPGYGYESGDPYAGFLPPALRIGVDASEDGLRAVVFVTGDTKKGTSRGAQEYESPLLLLTGAEYEVMPFQGLHDWLCNVLRGGGPQPTLQIFVPGSAPTLVFDDGSTTVVPGDEEPRG